MWLKMVGEPYDTFMLIVDDTDIMRSAHPASMALAKWNGPPHFSAAAALIFSSYHGISLFCVKQLKVRVNN
jgi:hypothetical protein